MQAEGLVRRCAGEFVGTFAIVFVAAGAIVYGDLVGAALAYGLATAVMVTAVGPGATGFFNPALTLALAATRRLGAGLACAYVAVQLGAAALAALLLRWILPATPESGSHLGAPVLAAGVDAGKGVVLEAVLTFFLAWIVYATALDPRRGLRQAAGFAIGLAVAADTLMGLGLSGAAVNPARAFGPQLVGNHWGTWWVWYAGPVAGAVVAALAYEALSPGGRPQEAAGTAASDEALR